jgi:tetratricopeptide (TPR) repeat protein
MDMRLIACVFVNLILACLLMVSQAIAQAHSGFDQEPTLKQKAEIYLYRNEFSESISYYKKAIEKDKTDAYLFRGLAQAFNRSGKTDEGTDIFNQYLQTSPPNALYGLGYLHYLMKEEEQSQTFLREAIKMNPQHTLAMNNLGAILSEENVFEEALSFVKRAISINPKEGMFYRNLQIIYSKMGKGEVFESEYEGALKEGVTDMATGYGKAFATYLRQQGFKYFSQGKVEKSVKAFEKVVQVYRTIQHPGGELAGLFGLGSLYEKLGNEEKAFELYHEILKINPNHIQAKQKLESHKKIP